MTRGTAINPANRFHNHASAPLVDEDVWWETGDDAPPLRTDIREERPRSALSKNDSPDIPFDRALNPYRGCEHGCVYCFARPTHEFLDLSAGLDFETKLIARPGLDAALRKALQRPGYAPAPIAIGTATDPYQPVERRLRLTRACLAVLAETRHPFAITTKSAAIRRDLDLIAPAAAAGRAGVLTSITTLDRRLAAALEPRAATPALRLDAIRALSGAGVPVAILVSPVIPGLTDHEIEAILEAGTQAGGTAAGWSLLRLPGAVQPIMEDWLATHAPNRAAKVLNLLRAASGGDAVYDSTFGRRTRGRGPYAALLDRRFHAARRRLGLAGRAAEEGDGGPDFWGALDASAFTPRPEQGDLFA